MRGDLHEADWDKTELQLRNHMIHYASYIDENPPPKPMLVMVVATLRAVAAFSRRMQRWRQQEMSD
jgi:hypothetical protein